MSRDHRIQVPGIIYHVFTRGNEKMRIYKDAADRKIFLKLIKIALQKYKFELYAYVLMSNHYHLLIKPGPTAPLSRIMQYINGKYAARFNWKYDRVGHLFEKRYSNPAVEESDYLFEVLRYIHLNPVRKKMVKSPEDYEWSSHNEYLGRVKTGLINKDFILDSFGKTAGSRIKEFRDFVGNASSVSAFEEAACRIDRLIAGSGDFAGQIFEKASELRLKIPEWRFRVDAGEPAHIIKTTCEVFDIDKEEMMRKKGKWNRAKKAVIYLLWKKTTLSPQEIAALFGNVHHTNIKRIINSAEVDMGQEGIFRENMRYLCSFNFLKHA